MKPEILFISHDCSRTGAPIILLNFVRWFKQNTNIPFRIILARDGELQSEFIKLAPVFIFEQKPNNSLYQRIKRRLIPGKTSLGLKKWLSGANIGLIYSNTIVNGHILESLEFLNCPVISHVHELEYTIQIYGIETIKKTIKYTTHFIACANIVKTNLVEQHQTLRQNIAVIHEFIPLTPNKINYPHQKLLENEINCPEQTFIVGASGTTDWRKGVDLFIQLAYLVKGKSKDALIKFVWVGGKCEGFDYFGLQQDIFKAGLQDYVHLIGSKPNPLDYFVRFDVFVLTSREDPYPLVCLENASLEKPIICFDKSGGESEFVEDDCGFVVPYLDVNAMADRVIELYHSPELRRKLGANAKQKVIERHDLNSSAPKVLEVIKKYVN